MKQRMCKILILSLVLAILIPSLVLASDTTNDVITELQKDNTNGPLAKAKKEAKTFSSEIFNIVRIVVVAVLVIRLFILITQFSEAGDNPQVKASIKKRMAWLGGGIILAVNFWNLWNLFKGIKVF